MATPPLRLRKSWAALALHHAQVKDLHLRQLFASDPRRGERMTLEAAGIFLDYSKNRVTDETLRLLLQLAEESGLREQIDAMFRGEKINVTEDRAVLHVALRAPRGASIVVDGKNVVPEVHAVLDRMAAFSDARAGRRLEGAHRQADPERRQHRHRRLRPRAGDGLRGAPALQRSGADVPLRLERGRDGPRRGHPRPRPGGDSLRRLLEDLHHARDDDERPERPGVVARRARRRPEGGGAPLRGGLDQRREGGRVRHRHRQHVRLLGLGGRALLDGLRHRPLHDARRRARTASAPCSAGSTRWTSTSGPRPSSGTCRC